MRLLLIISGSIAAYKSLELIRLMRERGHEVTCVLTEGGKQFVTPMSVAALSGKPVYDSLFSLKDEVEMGHIRLSREADAVLVAPASADLLAKMATGRADDLASTVLLATDKPVFAAPAMNVQMWKHPATQRNVAQLNADGIRFIGPAAGALACGEQGEGRMLEPLAIADALEVFFNPREDAVVAPLTSAIASLEKLKQSLNGQLGSTEEHNIEAVATAAPSSPAIPPMVAPAIALEVASAPELEQPAAAPPIPRTLVGKSVLITAGPTWEPLDPVRYLGNRSSGRQGYALAAALRDAGAAVTLVSGPTALSTPEGMTVIRVESADQMLSACSASLPVDIFIGTAAVADWTPETADQKIKKTEDGQIPEVTLSETIDILRYISSHPHKRPALVIGFAAETEADTGKLRIMAREKRQRKGCDWLLANDVSNGAVFGSDNTRLLRVTRETTESWPPMSKTEAARRITQAISAFFRGPAASTTAVPSTASKSTAAAKTPMAAPENITLTPLIEENA